MRILYLGDLVGEGIIEVLKNNLESIKKEHHIQMVLANGENVTKGKGLSFKHYKELKSLGIAGFSMGNHTFSRFEIKTYIDDATIVRPANLNCSLGKKVLYIQFNQEKIALINILGRTFINMPLNCPFQTMDALLKEVEADKIIVDFHGEATSEKKAFLYHYSGKVDAILGTHTHVQTADEEVLKNTCYITDMGMCGPKDSILGEDIQQVINRFQTGLFEPLAIAESKEYVLNGVILDLGKENKIERFHQVVCS